MSDMRYSSLQLSFENMSMVHGGHTMAAISRISDKAHNSVYFWERFFRTELHVMQLWLEPYSHFTELSFI